MAAFAGLWAEDGILEFPFAAPGYPPRIAGRAAVADYMRGYPDILDVREIPQKVLHQTSDPDLVIVEFEAAGIVVATGQPYTMRYVAVITVRNSEIELPRLPEPVGGHRSHGRRRTTVGRCT